MSGPPPIPPERLVTLANWERAPYNRWGFQHVRELVPVATIARAPRPRLLAYDEKDLLDLTFRSGGRAWTLERLLSSNFTDGFLVVHDGKVACERYWNGMEPGTLHLLMSVSKSVTAAAAGVLAGEGRLELSARVEEVVAELADTSFSGATVQQLLDMRAGTHFEEDYDDPAADVSVYEEVYRWAPPGKAPVAASALEYFSTLHNDGPHGGPFRYRSILTDVMAWLIERAAGARFHEVVSRCVWQPMGAEFDGEVTVDGEGNALADGGICATLRDLGRFGLLYLNRGRIGRRAVLPADFVEDTLRGAPDGAAAFRAGGEGAGHPRRAHYRNYWWVRDPTAPFLAAWGIHGQYIFVHGPTKTVVVKLSSAPRPDDLTDFTAVADATVAIGEHLAAGRG